MAPLHVNSTYLCRYFAVVVVIGATDINDAERFQRESIGPYNEEEANEASSSQQAYGYIAGIVMTDSITYPYPYILGDGSTTGNGMEFVNVPLQPGTVYYVLVRAHTSSQAV